jgi:hypothetical protein
MTLLSLPRVLSAAYPAAILTAAASSLIIGASTGPRTPTHTPMRERPMPKAAACAPSDAWKLFKKEAGSCPDHRPDPERGE